MSLLYETENLRIEKEESEIPWLKIFTKYPYKEMSEVPSPIKLEIYTLLDIIEKEMIAYYNPTKINIASFGNYVPHVHWHIMARFSEDSYFPEPMWGEKQRESQLKLPDFKLFCKNIVTLIS
jgi:diadenosine tetraphosphate (Ap4A) HIT family hydrolase